MALVVVALERGPNVGNLNMDRSRDVGSEISISTRPSAENC